MLGKGLESLIPKKHHRSDDNAVSDVKEGASEAPAGTVQGGEAPVPEPAPDQGSRVSEPVFFIEVDKIILNPFQPRSNIGEETLRELAASIREFGILQPLVVLKVEEDSELGTTVTYQLIAGQRRLMAAKMLGFPTVPVMIRAPGKRTETLEIAIVENIQRQDLNAVETARAYARLSDEFGMTQREIAQRLGKSREAIANALRLLSLSGEVQDALAKGAINESQARLLMSVQDPAAQQELFRQLVGENLSVRQLKQRIGQTAQGSAGTQEAQEPALRAQDLQLKAIEKEIAEVVGAPVKIEFSRSGGKIIIHFFSPEEAMGIAERIRPKNAMDM